MLTAATESYRMSASAIREPLVIHMKFVDHKNETHVQIQNAALEPNAIKLEDELIVYAQLALSAIHSLSAWI